MRSVDVMSAFSVRARYVFPVDRPPIGGGVVTIDEGRIAAVGRRAEGRRVIDLGDVALLPAAVNAHAHLEFSGLERPLGEAGMPLAAWIDRVLAWRQQGSTARGEAIARGIGEAGRTGTALLAEIATGGVEDYPKVGPGPVGILFWETIAPRSADRAAARDRARQRLEESAESLAGWPCGLSPHAPYTVHAETVARLARLSAERHVPLAMHVAESAEEIELLATGGGPLRELLEARGAWDPAAFAAPQRPLDTLRRIAGAHRSLVVHGNFLDSSEWEFLAEHRQRMAVVFCPRTHAYFGHPPYPLARALALGVPLAVGTDGRGSNPDLNLWRELFFLAHHFAEVAPAAILEIGTLGGARALGHAGAFGSITPGKRADLVALAWSGGNRADPHEALFREPPQLVHLWRRGQAQAPDPTNGQ